MKEIIVDYLMIAILTVLAFFMIYVGINFLDINVLCSIAMIIGITWWIICNNQRELMDEIKDLKKEIKELKEKKWDEIVY